MSAVTYFTEMPESILYMPINSSQADVWLRKNIEEYTDDEGNAGYQADEVYFRTTLSKDAVTEQFDTLFENVGSGDTETEEDGTVSASVSEENRIAALEAALLELAALYAESLYEVE